MTFEGIYGHDDVKKKLADTAASNTVSHAYIFSGKNGIGKSSVAKAFANFLTDGSETDIITVTNEYYGIKEKASLSVEAVRASRADIYTKPYLADKRVFLFPDAHTMTPAAQNALLKVFEEPPSYCVIILLAQNENALLPTIRSRAVTIRFSPLSDDTVAKYLIDRYGSADLLVIRLAGGSIENAKAFMSQEGTVETAKEFASVFKRLAMGDEAAVFEGIAFFDKEKPSYNTLLDVMEIMLGDCLLNNCSDNDIISVGGIKTCAAAGIIDHIEKARRAIATSRNYNMVISELLLEAWRKMND